MSAIVLTHQQIGVFLHRPLWQARVYVEDSDVRFDDRWEAVRTVVLLALDDFGAQSDTAWAREKLYQLVNYRVPQVRHNLPTVRTSKGWSGSSRSTTAASPAA